MQGRKNLMTNKTKLTFLSLVLSAAMILGACGKHTSSSEAPVESSIAPSENTSEVLPVSSDNGSDITSEVQPITSSNAPSSQKSSEQGPSSSQAPISQSSSEQQSSSAPASQSSSVTPSSSINNKCTVTFIVEGEVVYTTEVDKGDLVTYRGPTPTKQGDASSPEYRFIGWDKSLDDPIMADTVFTAVFAAYANAMVIDDFEQYEESAELIDEGWTALGYNNGTGQWTDQTAATVSLGLKSVEGQKALKFEAWENGVGYKFAKTFQQNEFTSSANAIQFRLMTPSINNLTVLLNGLVTIQGTTVSPVFKYRLTPISSEYVEYTIPFNDPNWGLWDQTTSIVEACDWTGIHQDDLVKYLTGIEFYLQGNDGGNGLPYKAFLDSVKFVTLDNPTFTQNETLEVFDRYTGTLNSEHIVRIDVNSDNSATATVIDLEVPQQIPGQLNVNGNSIEFVSADNGATLKYTGRLTNGGQLIKFVEATGALASEVDGMNLNGVQVVNNFEQYETDGVLYYENNTPNDRSGCRGDFYAEYYTGSSGDRSPWGGAGWKLMGGDGSQLKLKKDSGAHTGNQYLCMKNASGFGMRYMQWGLYDGSSEKNSFRGSKMGFWAKTNGVVKSFNAYLYSQNAPTNATRDQYVKSATFTESAALGEWKHYEVELNPNVVYYGFMFFLSANWTADSYLYIDDIEVYGADPYAHYEEPIPEPEKDYNLVPGSVYYAKMNDFVKMILRVDSLEEVALRIPGFQQEVIGTYTVDEYEIEIHFADDVYKVTTNDYKDKLTFKSLSGTGAAASILNNISFDLEIGDNAESYDDDGLMYYQGNSDASARSGARGAYFCDYYPGGSVSDPLGGTGWSLMGGSGDQLKLNVNDAYQGSQSLLIKKNTDYDMRYLQWGLFDGSAQPIKGMNKFVVYLKNPNSEEIKVRVMVYKIQQIAPGTQGPDNRAGIDFPVPANSGWVRCELELNPETTYYGFGFMPMKGGSVTGYIGVDYAHYVKTGNESDLNFYSKKGVTFTNAYEDATITFGDPGELIFNYPSASIENVTCEYTMEMEGNTQVMTFTVNGITLKGTYSVQMNGHVSFYIEEIIGGTLGGLLVYDSFDY